MSFIQYSHYFNVVCSLLADKNSAKLCLNESFQENFKSYLKSNGFCYGSRNLTFDSVTKLYHDVPFGIFDENKANQTIYQNAV